MMCASLRWHCLADIAPSTEPSPAAPETTAEATPPTASDAQPTPTTTTTTTTDTPAPGADDTPAPDATQLATRRPSVGPKR